MSRFAAIMILLFLYSPSAYAYVCSYEGRTLEQDLYNKKKELLVACYQKAEDGAEYNGGSIVAHFEAISSAKLSCEEELSAPPEMIKELKCTELEEKLKDKDLSDTDNPAVYSLLQQKEKIGCL